AHGGDAEALGEDVAEIPGQPARPGGEGPPAERAAAAAGFPSQQGGRGAGGAPAPRAAPRRAGARRARPPAPRARRGLRVGGACDGGGVVLVVDLKTDYLASRQFFGVRTEVGDPALSSVMEREDTFASASGDYLRGERVAELTGLAPGTVGVRVTLLDALGQP